MRTLVLALLSLTLVAAIAGCGSSSSDDSSDATTTTAEAAGSTDPDEATTTAPTDAVDPGELTRDDYVEAVVENLTSGSEEDGNLVIARDQAECLAPRWVDAMTVEALQEGDVTVADLSEPTFSTSELGLELAQGEAMVDAFGDCDVDIVAIFATALTQGLGDDVEACVQENVDPTLVRALLAKTFSSGQSDAEFSAVLAQLDPLCELPDV